MRRWTRRDAERIAELAAGGQVGRNCEQFKLLPKLRCGDSQGKL